MRLRALILMFAIAALGGGALAACGDDSSDTISLGDWVKEIEAACGPATEKAGQVETPAALQTVTDPSELTDEQLKQFGDYLAEIQDIINPAVESIADAGTPDEKADQAEEYMDDISQGQDKLDAAVESAQAGDLEQFLKDYEAFTSDNDNSTALEEELGITCGPSE